ncbi:uncharacterized protein A1O5_04120 [Cladophialophora psammophila CBS 110553]|uniref:Uncharacterized protein n=1 Tax=Cladophialophora psammophila CBS 110553 TaxID=1182543 RepID=W9X7S9_9EURO|nr:uncharacterized protein A1O5_04120 [Cladophialophora psammophila CBS 110553]EXJ72971.1 hypothetical protein A1O5_04120 [Cladophialophora psammophila CBS 110553]
MPGCKRPTVIKTDIASNTGTAVAAKGFRPSSSNRPTSRARGVNSSLYNLPLMTPAPPPRIRTEENSPAPELFALVESAIERRSPPSRPPHASQKGEAQEEMKATTKTGTIKERRKTTKKQKIDGYSLGEPGFAKYMEDLLERRSNPPPTIGPEKYSSKPPPDIYANADECNKMLWDWKLQVRFVKLKEHFAVTGELEFPPGWLERWPGDMKYKITSDRKKKKNRLINARTEALEEIDDLLSQTVKRTYRDYGEKVSRRRLKARWERIAGSVKPDKDVEKKQRDEGGRGGGTRTKRTSMSKAAS